jgi:phage antirepressor YoqD-like protein
MSETAAQKPKSIKKTYYIKGVSFDTIEEYVAIRKHQAGFTVDTHIFQTNALETEYATKEAEIRKLWETIEPMDPKDAFKDYASNAQRLMTVMSIMGPEKTFQALESKVFHTETITKVQKRTFLKDPASINFESKKTEKSPSVSADIFDIKEVTYNDTYTLHKIDKSIFGESSSLENDVFVLQVECPSTHQHYYIFVDGREPQCQDAIGAVAWTMVKENGECLTKEEYLTLQSEA